MSRPVKRERKKVEEGGWGSRTNTKSEFFMKFENGNWECKTYP